MKTTKDIIAVIIVLGFIATLFFPVNDIAQKVLIGLMGIVVGNYYSAGQIPLAGVFKKS
jgi:1,4-dihydroxy-2-naphthoate octaprenyltransferase